VTVAGSLFVFEGQLVVFFVTTNRDVSHLCEEFRSDGHEFVVADVGEDGIFLFKIVVANIALVF